MPDNLEQGSESQVTSADGAPVSEDTILLVNFLRFLGSGIHDKALEEQFAVRVGEIIDIHLAKLGPERTDREDIRQDILSRLFADEGRRFRTLDHQSGGGLNNWLARVVRNAVIDRSRRPSERLAQRSYSLDVAQDRDSAVPKDNLPSPTQEPGEAMDREAHRMLIAKAMMRLLTEDERMAIGAWSASSGGYEAVAHSLGMTPAKVRMLIHRGVKKLRESLGKRSGIH